jgi:hypothetical protein
MTTSQPVRKPVGRPTAPAITYIAVPGWRLTFIADFVPVVAGLLALLPYTYCISMVAALLRSGRAVFTAVRHVGIRPVA